MPLLPIPQLFFESSTSTFLQAGAGGRERHLSLSLSCFAPRWWHSLIDRGWEEESPLPHSWERHPHYYIAIPYYYYYYLRRYSWRNSRNPRYFSKLLIVLFAILTSPTEMAKGACWILVRGQLINRERLFSHAYPYTVGMYRQKWHAIIVV